MSLLEDNWTDEKSGSWYPPVKSLRERSRDSRKPAVDPPTKKDGYSLINRALTANLAHASSYATDLLGWLRKQPQSVVRASVRELELAIKNTPVLSLREVAILELMALFDPERAYPQFIRAADQRPLGEFHIHVVAFLQRFRTQRYEDAGANSLVSILVDVDAVGTSTRVEIVAEAFDALSVISPQRLMMGSLIARFVESCNGFEETRLLEAIARASRQLTSAVDQPFRDLLNLCWDRQIETDESADNAVGVAACLLEIEGRCEGDFQRRIAALRGHSLEYRILYQLTQRPLDFLREDQRQNVLERTLMLLLKNEQYRSMSELVLRLDSSSKKAFQKAIESSAIPSSRCP